VIPKNPKKNKPVKAREPRRGERNPVSIGGRWEKGRIERKEVGGEEKDGAKFNRKKGGIKRRQ